MPVFAFEAIKEDGQKVKSEVTAESKDEAIRKIQDKGLHPTRIKAEKKEFFWIEKERLQGQKDRRKVWWKAQWKAWRKAS
jgi:type II secretory pathway component PulF